MLVAAMFLSLGAASCESRSRVHSPDLLETSTYRGVFLMPPGLLASGREGTISMTRTHRWGEATADSVTVQFVEQNIRSTFPGRFDLATGRLTVSGLPWLESREVNGRLRDAVQDRIFFAVIRSDSPHAYTGTWTGTTGGLQGRFGFVIEGRSVVGVAAPYLRSAGSLEGAYASNGSIAMTHAGITFTGSASGGTIRGTYESPLLGSHTGTWIARPSPF